MYCQLSARVKVMVAEYVNEEEPSAPPATTCDAVESGKAPEQPPVVPDPVTPTEEQVTVTAEAGTVGQLVKEGEIA